MTLSQRQGKRLGLKAHSSLSPVLEKCGLRLCAQSSYQQAEENLRTLLGVQVGHSCLHRLVQRVALPDAQAVHPVSSGSVDGGKIRIQNPETGQGEWRDYKAVSLHDGVCAAFFQAPDTLQAWSEAQPLSPIFTYVGDGHAGVWKIAQTFGGKQVVLQRQVLDWYHLVENLHKVGGSLKRLKEMETLLWCGQVEAVLDGLEGLRGKGARCFQAYLREHRHRIPHYSEYQRLGIAIGSGSVESQIKQIAARVKLTGAMWKRENVPQILRLRCAYLNQDACLSISA